MYETTTVSDYTGNSLMETTAAEDNSLASFIDNTESLKRQFDVIINDYLIEWGQNPRRYEEEDLVPPTKIALDKAFRLVKYLRDERWPAPQRTVPNGDGGINFEWRHGSYICNFCVDSNGELEIIEMRDSKIRLRQILS